MTFLEAIAREEGFFAVGSRSQRNHNPGDIEYGRFAVAHGATGSDGRFAIFPDADTGFAAMASLFQAPAYANTNVTDALNKWAPPVENQTNRYIADVCHWANVTPTTPIAGLLHPTRTVPSIPNGAAAVPPAPVPAATAVTAATTV